MSAHSHSHSPQPALKRCSMKFDPRWKPLQESYPLFLLSLWWNRWDHCSPRDEVNESEFRTRGSQHERCKPRKARRIHCAGRTFQRALKDHVVGRRRCYRGWCCHRISNGTDRRGSRCRTGRDRGRNLRSTYRPSKAGHTRLATPEDKVVGLRHAV